MKQGKSKMNLKHKVGSTLTLVLEIFFHQKQEQQKQKLICGAVSN